MNIMYSDFVFYCVIVSTCPSGSLRTCRCSDGKSTTAWRTRRTASTATTWWADIPHRTIPPVPQMGACPLLHLSPPPLCISLVPLSLPLLGPGCPGENRLFHLLLLTNIHDLRECCWSHSAKCPAPAQPSPAHSLPLSFPLCSFFDISIYKYIQIYFKASLTVEQRGAHVRAFAAEGGVGGREGLGIVRWGPPVNVVICFCPPCIDKHTGNIIKKTRVHFFPNILNNVYKKIEFKKTKNRWVEGKKKNVQKRVIELFTV